MTDSAPIVVAAQYSDDISQSWCYVDGLYNIPESEAETFFLIR